MSLGDMDGNSFNILRRVRVDITRQKQTVVAALRILCSDLLIELEKPTTNVC